MSHHDSAVRPIGEVFSNEGGCVPCGQGDQEEEIEDEDISAEGRVIKGQSRVVKSTQQEFDDHMRTHIPYRKLCEQCVRGKRKSGGIIRQEDDIKESEECQLLSMII